MLTARPSVPVGRRERGNDEGPLSSCVCAGLAAVGGVLSPKPSRSLGTSSRLPERWMVPRPRGTAGVGNRARTGME